MSKAEQSSPETDETRVVMRRHRACLWLAAAAAVLISVAWLVSGQKGPVAQVRFPNAEGVEPGKTEVRCLGVKVGVVEKVDYSEDLRSVVLGLRMDPERKKLLRRDSRFWIERPRIKESPLAGIATLFSGAYVELKPGDDEVLAHHFEGLEEPLGTIINAAQKKD